MHDIKLSDFLVRHPGQNSPPAIPDRIQIGLWGYQLEPRVLAFE